MKKGDFPPSFLSPKSSFFIFFPEISEFKIVGTLCKTAENRRVIVELKLKDVIYLSCHTTSSNIAN